MLIPDRSARKETPPMDCCTTEKTSTKSDSEPGCPGSGGFTPANWSTKSKVRPSEEHAVESDVKDC